MNSANLKCIFNHRVAENEFVLSILRPTEKTCDLCGSEAHENIMLRELIDLCVFLPQRRREKN